MAPAQGWHAQIENVSLFVFSRDFFFVFTNRREKKTEKANNTWGSHLVTHDSTNQARRCLTAEIGRDPVFSTWYGRKRSLWLSKQLPQKTKAHEFSVQNRTSVKRGLWKSLCRAFWSVSKSAVFFLSNTHSAASWKAVQKVSQKPCNVFYRVLIISRAPRSIL